jgi:inosose dehydratase
MLGRREFLGVSLGAAAAVAAAAPGSKIRWAISGNILFGRDADLDRIKLGARQAAKFHFEGIEPFTTNVNRFLDQPLVLKEVLDPLGLTFSTCSSGGDFVTPDGSKQTIETNLKLARDFLRPLGSKHLKVNIAGGGPRREEGTSVADLKATCASLNELGKRVHDEAGMKFGFHPHLGSIVQNEHETRFALEHTDPKYVGLVPDTAHLSLGGMDPVKLVRENWSRVIAIHIKDTDPKFRGGKVTPTKEELGNMGLLYKTLGTGGVDFVAFFELLQQKNYDYWVNLDFDPPGPGQGTVEDNLANYTKYLQKTIKVWS